MIEKGENSKECRGGEEKLKGMNQTERTRKAGEGERRRIRKAGDELRQDGLTVGGGKKKEIREDRRETQMNEEAGGKNKCGQRTIHPGFPALSLDFRDVPD